MSENCNFCPTPRKDDPKKMDFASDDKPEKQIARDMYRMTFRINKKYFHYKQGDTTAVAPVGCMTCHHGKEHPENSAPAKNSR